VGSSVSTQEIRIYHTSDWEPNQGGESRKDNWQSTRLRREYLFDELDDMLTRILETPPHILLLAGDLFEGSKIYGSVLADWTREQYERLLDRLVSLQKKHVHIFYALGSHDIAAWRSTPGWRWWTEFPGTILGRPEGEILRNVEVGGHTVIVLGFGSLGGSFEQKGSRKGDKARRQIYAGHIDGFLRDSHEWSDSPTILISLSYYKYGSWWRDKPVHYVALGGLETGVHKIKADGARRSRKNLREPFRTALGWGVIQGPPVGFSPRHKYPRIFSITEIVLRKGNQRWTASEPQFLHPVKLTKVCWNYVETADGA